MNNSASPRIAINVMRSRLTVVGVNVAVVSFQVPQLFKLKGGVVIPGIDHSIHFRADIALLMALVFSLLALVAFIASTSLDEVGYCDHWSFIAGDLLMYLGLANAITGFISPLHQTFQMALQSASVQDLNLAMLGSIITVFGSIIWFATFYIGPIVTLKRSPFSRMGNLGLSLGYVVLLLIVFWVFHQAVNIELSVLSNQEKVVIPYYYELLQPLLW
ncbi:hypothetical protein VIN01S_26220 [Vibrio inusitatus NBRC 102082]|uniref:Uncharacterized protein n=1 Tax=Vibrio inusitatus NBRC 102082 TaxID=1219070 RepID=A0A4Y3HXT3_9VIBR|nr:hypothetical protein [Vibrio inusitatus]GEA51818.1 hypothetical protein VIN01S_26220 [Vibrio inusitatus NBRC 102082]